MTNIIRTCRSMLVKIDFFAAIMGEEGEDEGVFPFFACRNGDAAKELQT